MNAQTELWVKVCSTDELPNNMGICAKVGDKQVAIFKITTGDSFQLYGLDNYDPFSDANVLSRGIVGDLKGHDVVASPIYKQHFILESGTCLEQEDVSIPVYKVRDSAGMIEVLLGQPA